MTVYEDVPSWIGCSEGDNVPSIGFVFECQPGGPDSQVYRAFLERLVLANELAPFKFVPTCMTNTEYLLQGAGKVTKNLLADGCSHVFVCWDLYPEWEPKPATPCRKNDRGRLLASLTDAGVNHADCTPICISQELEAWLLADGAALVALKKRDAQPRTKHENNPETLDNPKALMKKRWADLKNGKYNDWFHAVEIAKVATLSRVVKCPSFQRLICKAKIVLPGAQSTLVQCPQ